jgi:hypothetical protein
MHQLLVQCQCLGDHKVKLSAQIIETLSTKARQLGVDSKSSEDRRFQIELDEDKILSEFRAAIKRNRSIHLHHSHYSSGGSSGTSVGRSSRNLQAKTSANATASSLISKQNVNSVDINKAMSKYITTSHSRSACGPSGAHSSTPTVDAYSFDDQTQSPFGGSHQNGNEVASRSSNKKSLRNNKFATHSSPTANASFASENNHSFSASKKSTAKKMKLDNETGLDLFYNTLNYETFLIRVFENRLDLNVNNKMTEFYLVFFLYIF